MHVLADFKKACAKAQNFGVFASPKIFLGGVSNLSFPLVTVILGFEGCGTFPSASPNHQLVLGGGTKPVSSAPPLAPTTPWLLAFPHVAFLCGLTPVFFSVFSPKFLYICECESSPPQALVLFFECQVSGRWGGIGQVFARPTAGPKNFSGVFWPTLAGL